MKNFFLCSWTLFSKYMIEYLKSLICVFGGCIKKLMTFWVMSRIYLFFFSPIWKDIRNLTLSGICTFWWNEMFRFLKSQINTCRTHTIYKETHLVQYVPYNTFKNLIVSGTKLDVEKPPNVESTLNMFVCTPYHVKKCKAHVCFIFILTATGKDSFTVIISELKNLRNFLNLGEFI